MAPNHERPQVRRCAWATQGRLVHTRRAAEHTTSAQRRGSVGGGGRGEASFGAALFMAPPATGGRSGSP
eukprot:2413723-Alexandrium_andersonii.AAC.2